EARAAARLDHDHIIKIHGCDQLPTGEAYIAMDYLDGRPLTAIWEATAKVMSERLVLFILAQVCDALEVAHNAGIVHRDLKPDNICITVRPGNSYHVTVLDFGIAKVSHRDRTLTQQGMALGTPDYMAPEQLANAASVDRRADIHALGVIAYQLVTGH